MKTFEKMKAALTAQAPLSENPEPVDDLPFRVGETVTYKVPVMQASRGYSWETHTGVILAVSAVAEMACLEPKDEPETPWRWIWWGYVEKVKDAQE